MLRFICVFVCIGTFFFVLLSDIPSYESTIFPFIDFMVVSSLGLFGFSFLKRFRLSGVDFMQNYKREEYVL